jgi:transcriptional regulator with XRE-family HTH domain
MQSLKARRWLVIQRLKIVRMEKGILQKQLSDAVGVSESYYCQLENGSRRMSLPVAQKIAQVLGVSLDDLFMPFNFAKCKVKEDAE